MTVLVVCGLNREAAIAAGPGILTLAGGGSRHTLDTKLAALDPVPLRAVVSFGLAGALAPDLPVGALVLPAAIAADDAEIATDPAMRAAWMLALDALAPREGVISGVDQPALTRDAKAALLAQTGAIAVDMESHLAARFAARHGLPFGAVRVVSDPADRDLPPIAGTAMRPDGSVDVLAVLAGLARDPAQLPALIRTGRDAGRAFAALGRVRGLLGQGFGLLGLDLR